MNLLRICGHSKQRKEGDLKELMLSWILLKWDEMDPWFSPQSAFGNSITAELRRLERRRIYNLLREGEAMHEKLVRSRIEEQRLA